MSAVVKKPEIIVFAGPNGSGKSTITQTLRPLEMTYINADDPQINVARVDARVSAGGHGVPRDKIISRYDKALAIVKELVLVCDVCHIYDNSVDAPCRIFKKRKDLCWYCTERHLWLKADILALTGVKNAKKAPLNKHS